LVHYIKGRIQTDVSENRALRRIDRPVKRKW
jgi:hypothetical protein